MQSPSGREIVKDLIANRNLWQAVLSNDSEGKDHAIKLRELERATFSLGNISIGIKKNKKDDFARLVQKWNPIAVEILPLDNSASDELIVELSF